MKRCPFCLCKEPYYDFARWVLPSVRHSHLGGWLGVLQPLFVQVNVQTPRCACKLALARLTNAPARELRPATLPFYSHYSDGACQIALSFRIIGHCSFPAPATQRVSLLSLLHTHTQEFPRQRGFQHVGTQGNHILEKHNVKATLLFTKEAASHRRC